MWKHQDGTNRLRWTTLAALAAAGGDSRNSARAVAPGRWMLGRHRVSRLGADAGRPPRAKGCVGRGRASGTAGRQQAQALPGCSVAGTMRSSPDDPTVCDEERIRLRAMGWLFSEHLTAQESGRVGWVVSGTRRGRRIRAVDDDRSDAWGTALILAGVTST